MTDSFCISRWGLQTGKLLCRAPCGQKASKQAGGTRSFQVECVEVHFESDLSTMNSEFIAEIQNFFIIIILYSLGHKILTKNPLWGAGLLPRGQWAGF